MEKWKALLHTKHKNVTLIIDLNLKHCNSTTPNLLEENIQENINDLGINKYFLDTTQSTNQKKMVQLDILNISSQLSSMCVCYI